MRRRTPQTTRISLVFLLSGLLLLSSHGTARADEDPAARTRALAAGFPAPEAGQGFEISCYVLNAGAPHGRLTLSARPDTVAGQRVWRVRDAIKPVAAGGDRVVVEAVLDRHLGCLSGSYHRRNARGFLRAKWSRTDVGGYAFEQASTEYENTLFVQSAQPAFCTISSLLLFLRLAPVGSGSYVFPELDPDPAGGDPLVTSARLDVHAVAPWRVAGKVEDAWIVSFTRGKQSARIALHAKDGRFLGLDFVGLPFMFVPAGSGPVGLAHPEQAGVATPIQRAVARTRALRAALPAPTEEFDFRGDVRLGDAVLGRVRLWATPTSFEGEPAWLAVETQRRESGEAVVTWLATSFLGRDLRTLRGEHRDERPEGRTVSTFVRRGPAMETVHERAGERRPMIQAAAPAGAVSGLLPVLLFLRRAPPEPALYVLPGFDPRWAESPKAGAGSLTTNVADVHVDVKGAAVLELAGTRKPSWMARCSLRTGRVYEVHLDPKSRRLLAVVGQFPKITLAPSGLPSEPATWYDAVEGAPRSARQAFVKFGRGYHLPRRDLLADAFHWPSMCAVALERGRYAAGTPESVIRKDWIDVFVKMSKHRTPADCDDLLCQMFMTSTETHNPDGSIRIATLPVYGGHAYLCREIDGRWYIVRID